MMKKLYFVFLILLCSLFSYSQDKEEEVSPINFSEALRAHLKKYNIQSDIAFINNDKQKGQILFDSLVSHHLVGTQFEDYTLKSFEKRKVKLSSFKKPVFILTYASWCIPSKGEIPA